MVLERIVHVTMTPIACAYLCGMALIDAIAITLDRTFNTQLRTPKTTADEVEHLIASHISIGSSSAEIFAFLKLHGILHDEQVEEVVISISPHLKHPKLDRKTEFIRKRVVAWINNIGRWLLYTDDIFILFYLDEQNNLIEYIVDTRFTGI
jgi:hypothetical protein